ncbi:hypothetical protein pb186bvf_010823 [Paramecium bursaria]
MNKLYIGKIKDVNKQELCKLFSNYGLIKNFEDKETFCFIEFCYESDARIAQYELDGKQILNSKIIVQFSKGHQKQDDLFKEAFPGMTKKIYVGGLNHKFTTQDMIQLFAKFGKILDIIFKDTYALIEYQTQQSATDAVLNMNEKSIKEEILKVDLQKSYDEVLSQSNRIYIGKIGNLKKTDLIINFGQFGFIEDITIKDDLYAFIQFRNNLQASKAIKEMNGADIKGNRIQVQEARAKNSLPVQVVYQATANDMFKQLIPQPDPFSQKQRKAAKNIERFIIMNFMILFIIYIASAYNIVEIINQLKTTWKATHYERFQQINPQKLFGSRIDYPFLDEIPIREIEILKDIPSSFDSRVKWSSCQSMKEIRDQGNCGSCWAVSAASVLSDRYCIAFKQHNPFSSQELLECCDFCGNDNDCDGGYPVTSFKYATLYGIVTGSGYKDDNYCKSYGFPPCDHGYDGKFGNCGQEHFLNSLKSSCENQCSKGSGRLYDKDKKKIKEYYRLNSTTKNTLTAQIMTEIIERGPVQATFIVHEDFLNYRGGIYQYKVGAELGGHSVKILGWGEEQGIKYWLCANSWNEYWGEQGFFRIVRESSLNIEDQVYAGVF